MQKIITVTNSSSQIIIAVSCVLSAVGISHLLTSIPQLNGFVKVTKTIDESYAEVLKTSHSIVIIELSEAAHETAEAIKFINWCRTVQPEAVIVANTRHQPLSVLNYIAAMGVRVIISQYESPAMLTELLIKSLSSRALLCSPKIKSLLKETTLSELTLCESQVIGQLFLGCNVSQVAYKLGRDIRTISSHKRHAMEKLGLHCEKDLHVLGCALLGK